MLLGAVANHALLVSVTTVARERFRRAVGDVGRLGGALRHDLWFLVLHFVFPSLIAFAMSVGRPRLGIPQATNGLSLPTQKVFDGYDVLCNEKIHNAFCYLAEPVRRYFTIAEAALASSSSSSVLVASLAFIGGYCSAIEAARHHIYGHPPSSGVLTSHPNTDG